MNNDALLALALIMALLLAFSLQGLAASGHFPKEHRAPALTSRTGAIVLHGSTAISALSLVVGILAAWQSIPWYAGVIGGGLVLLAAPLLLRLMSDAIVNSRALLVALGATSVALAVVLLAFAPA
jgi:hypothetical protein